MFQSVHYSVILPRLKALEPTVSACCLAFHNGFLRLRQYEAMPRLKNILRRIMIAV